MLKVVLTGGPCAGKTTILSHLVEELQQRGYKVFTIAETATDIFSWGICPNDNLSLYAFEKIILSQQLAREDIAISTAFAYNPDKVVIFFDRGIADIQAYIGSSYFDLLDEIGLSPANVFARYDAVLHMITAANGAEDKYQWNDPSKNNVGNNAARSESPELARLKDEETLNAWIGHPHLHIFDNSGSFDDKINNVIKEVFALLGEPVPKEIERKFLIKLPTNMSSLGVLDTTDIVQTYLTSTNNVEKRVRMRGTREGGYTFFYTEKTFADDNSRYEKERIIDRDDYLSYLASADTSLHQIKKTRTCFVYNNQHFELDKFPFDDEYGLLELEVSSIDDEISIPDCIEVIAEVTYNHNYYNYNLAKTYKLPKYEKSMHDTLMDYMKQHPEHPGAAAFRN